MNKLKNRSLPSWQIQFAESVARGQQVFINWPRGYNKRQVYKLMQEFKELFDIMKDQPEPTDETVSPTTRLVMNITSSNNNFSDALEYLKDGYAISRSGWNGKGQYLLLQRPDANSKMTLPYIYITTVTSDLVPWIASQSDILAEDWDVLK